MELIDIKSDEEQVRFYKRIATDGKEATLSTQGYVGYYADYYEKLDALWDQFHFGKENLNQLSYSGWCVQKLSQWYEPVNTHLMRLTEVNISFRVTREEFSI